MKKGFAILAVIFGLALGGCSKGDSQEFSKVDYNKDGKIIFEELIVAFPDLTVDEFLAADADHNNSLDAKEYARFLAARRSGKKLSAEDVQTAAPAAATETPTASAPETAAATAPGTADQAGQNLSGEPAGAPTQVPSTPSAAPDKATNAAAPAETVETVEVAQSAATAPQTTAYTVERGDTLSRIAKKFGLTTKELMAANSLKNPDRLEAGASLTIPAKPGSPAPAAAKPVSPEVTGFVAEYFNKSSAGDINGLIDLYAPSVEYRAKGKAGSDVVRQDKADQFQRWPKRTYKTGTITETALPNGDVRVTVPTAFAYANGAKELKGKAKYTLLLHKKDGAYRIAAEQVVIDAQK